MLLFCVEKIACMQSTDEQVIAFIDQNLVVRELPSFVNEDVDDDVTSVVFHPHEQKLMIGGDFGNAVLWDLSTRQRLKTLNDNPSSLNIRGREVAQYNPITSMSFSQDGKKIMINHSVGAICKVWDVDAAQLLHTLPAAGVSRDGIISTFFSPDAKKAFVCDGSGIEMWNVETGENIYSKAFKFLEVSSAALSPDGTQILISLFSGVSLCDVSTLAQIKKFAQTTHINSVAFRSDGKQFITGDGKAAKIWDIQSQAAVRTLPHDYPVKIVMFCPPGDKVITAARDTVRIWDVSTGNELKKIVHDGATVQSMAVSFDGHILATATRGNNAGLASRDYDRKTKIWDLRGYDAIQKELLKALKAKISARTNLAATEEQWRTFMNFPENVQVMLQRYISKPESLKSPTEKLMAAAKKGDLNTIKDLIEKQQVNPLTIDNEGHTAWYYAKQQQHHPVMRYAQELAAKKADQECCVCLEKVGRTQFEIGSQNYECLHFMCKDCKGNWKSFAPNPNNPHVLTQPVCPICRK